MEIQNKIGEQVFDKLRSRFSQITLGTINGKSTQDPSAAAFFNFTYADAAEHGNVTISLIDQIMKIYYSKDISTTLKGSQLSTWYKFLQDMRKTAMSNLYTFDTHDISKKALSVNDIQATVSRNGVQESKMYGSKRSSYQNKGPSKIIVRHNQKIDPEVRGARSRKIESVFIETCAGERFLMPFTSLPGARAMSQHVGNGGKPHDDMGMHITEMVYDISALRPFISANRNTVSEDKTTMEMIEAARAHYAECRTSLGQLAGNRGYKKYTENYIASESVEYTDEMASSMKERFTKKQMNNNIESAMETVNRVHVKKMRPQKPTMNIKSPMQISEFEEWANETTAMPVQEDATEEMCADACCGKPVSQCHCGPECEYCDCHAKNNPESELDEGIKGVLAGIAMLAGVWGVSNHMAQSAYDDSPQLQQLISLHQQADANGNNDYADKLEIRIANHKTRIDIGKGEVMDNDGNPKDVTEAVSFPAILESEVNEDVVLSKATPKDYLNVAGKGTPEAMVKALEKDGKDCTKTAAKAALKRHNEQNQDNSLKEAVNDIIRLAGL